MDLQKAQADIMAWIENFLEVPNAALDGWSPCPYARRARLEGLIDVRQGTDAYMDGMNLTHMGRYDVIAYVYKPQDLDGHAFERTVCDVNIGFLLPRGMIALSDHPDLPEIVNGVSMNQGQWAIMFVQELAKLNAHAKQLASKDFYAGWPESYLQELFKHREDPRT